MLSDYHCHYIIKKLYKVCLLILAKSLFFPFFAHKFSNISFHLPYSKNLWIYICAYVCVCLCMYVYIPMYMLTSFIKLSFFFYFLLNKGSLFGCSYFYMSNIYRNDRMQIWIMQLFFFSLCISFAKIYYNFLIYMMYIQYIIYPIFILESSFENKTKKQEHSFISHSFVLIS